MTHLYFKHDDSPILQTAFQAGAFNIWTMDQNQRSAILDDGLHLTASGYDKLGALIADFIADHS